MEKKPPDKRVTKIDRNLDPKDQNIIKEGIITRKKSKEIEIYNNLEAKMNNLVVLDKTTRPEGQIEVPQNHKDIVTKQQNMEDIYEQEITIMKKSMVNSLEDEDIVTIDASMHTGNQNLNKKKETQDGRQLATKTKVEFSDITAPTTTGKNLLDFINDSNIKRVTEISDESLRRSTEAFFNGFSNCIFDDEIYGFDFDT